MHSAVTVIRRTSVNGTARSSVATPCVVSLENAHGSRSYRTGRHRVTVREPYDRHAPREIVRAEAERMGRFFDPESTEREIMRPRSVPQSYADFAADRRRYQGEVHKVRLQYRSEWDARRQREKEAIAARRAEMNRRKVLRNNLKNLHKERRMEAYAKWMEMRSKARSAKEEAARRNQALWLSEVDHKRQQWFDELEDESRYWVTEDRIDEMINEDLFQMKYPWQYESYFANKAKKVLAEEQAAAQGHRAGVGGYPTDQDEYPTDWESEQEIDYSLDIFSPLDRAAQQGVQLEELYYSTPMNTLLKQKQQELGQYVDDAIQNGDFGDAAKVEHMNPRDKDGNLILDDGERALEEANLDFYRKTGHLEQLLPRLAHKRERMMRDHPEAWALREKAIQDGRIPDDFAVLRAAEKYGVAAVLGQQSAIKMDTPDDEAQYAKQHEDLANIFRVLSSEDTSSTKQSGETKEQDSISKLFDTQHDEDWTKDIDDLSGSDDDKGQSQR